MNCETSLRKLLTALPCGLECNDFHHAKKDQHHSTDQPCPVLSRYMIAVADARQALETPPKSSEPEKVPTPASDSVKGEVDKFERKIIRRNNDILLVEVGNGWTVCKDNGTVFWGASGIKKWVTEQSPQVRSTNEYAHALKLFSEATAATSLELPTANPAASAKGEDDDIDAMKRAWNGVSTTTSYREDFLFAELLKLKREVAALKAVK